MRIRMGCGRVLLGAALAGFCSFAGFGSQAQDMAFWNQYEARLTSQGLMRTDRDPADIRYTKSDLLREFQSIMLHNEHGQRGGRLVKHAAPRTLRKMDSEVRVSISGSTVDSADMANIRGMMDRLGRVTGVNLIESDHDPMIQLMILTAQERQELAGMAGANPRWSFISQNVASGSGKAVCSTYYSRDDQRMDQFDYVIVIPAEVTGLLRQSCIEEELGQAFGPGADSHRARPSIFNDDAEFALLTKHDEDLLRILYDPRLKAGMTGEQAMPIVHRILQEMPLVQ